MLYAISMSTRIEIAPQDFLYSDYASFFEKFGCKLILIPNVAKKAEDYFDNLPIKGIILSGGNDLSSEFTGQPAIDIRNASFLRDLKEKKLLDIAVKRSLPVFGICRGMQFINCYFGGSLSQRISEDPDEKNIHIAKSHVVSIRDKKAVDFFGKDRLEVNSYHHQGVRIEQLSAQLKVMGICERDNLVEALFHPSLPIAGIQWHPERKGSSADDDNKLVKAFFEGNLYWRRAY